MEKHVNILIADDDSDVTRSCLKLLMRDMKNAIVSYVSTPDDCLEYVSTERYDIVFLDIHFAGYSTSGLDLLPKIRAMQPEAKVFMLSSADDDRTIMRCMSLGAADFISKRDRKELSIIRFIENFQAGADENARDSEEGKRIAAERKIAFKSNAMLEVLRKAAFARRNKEMTVLITGETGVGKDVIAGIISHKNKPTEMVSVDCGAISSEIAESEFFGHMKGAFTGAIANKDGKFKLAHGGDLFLDEIGNLKPVLQEKLLRAIQTKEITPVGGTSAQTVDVRLIFATNEDLEKMVEQGKFRRDFFERMKGVWIRIPALRERPEDIPVIIQEIIARSNNKDTEIAPACMSILCNYPWPGNVRELENVMREILGHAHNGLITPRNLPQSFREKFEALTSVVPAEDLQYDDLHIPGTYKLPLEGTFKDIQAKFTKLYILDRLDALGANISKRRLARELGLSRSALERYEQELDLDLPSRGME